MINMGGNWSDSIELRTRGVVKHDFNYWFNYWLMWHPIATRVIIVVITVLFVALLVLLIVLAIICLCRYIHYSRTHSNTVTKKVNTFPRPRNAHGVFIPPFSELCVF